MTPDTTNHAPETTESPAKWLSVAVAAQSLGVSPRAIQKRAARGTLVARKIERGGKEVWEVDGRRMDANRLDDGREPFG